MLCSRIIAGVGVGFFITIVPVWSAEVSNKDHRGATFSWMFVSNCECSMKVPRTARMLSLVQVFGIFCAYWIGFGLSFINGGDSVIRWRLPLALQVVPPLVMIPLIWIMPESPRWLIKQGRQKEALRIITVLRGSGDPNSEDVKREYVDILETLEQERNLSNFNSYWSIITDYKKDKLHYGRRAWLGFGIQILMEVGTGTSLTTIYAPTIFKQAGFGTYKAGWLSGMNSTMGVLGTIASAFVIDRFGRRPILMVGGAVMGTCMVSLF